MTEFRVEIERVLLDGVRPLPGDASDLAGAVGAAFRRLIAEEGGPADNALSGPITLPTNASDRDLGVAIALAIYRAMPGEGRGA